MHIIGRLTHDNRLWFSNSIAAITWPPQLTIATHSASLSRKYNFIS